MGITTHPQSVGLWQSGFRTLRTVSSHLQSVPHVLPRVFHSDGDRARFGPFVVVISPERLAHCGRAWEFCKGKMMEKPWENDKKPNLSMDICGCSQEEMYFPCLVRVSGLNEQ